MISIDYLIRIVNTIVNFPNINYAHVISCATRLWEHEDRAYA